VAKKVGADAPKSVAITTDKQSSGVKPVDRQCNRHGRGRKQGQMTMGTLSSIEGAERKAARVDKSVTRIKAHCERGVLSRTVKGNHSNQVPVIEARAR